MRLRCIRSADVFRYAELLPPTGTMFVPAWIVRGLGVTAVAVQLFMFPDSKSSAKMVAALATSGEQMAAIKAKRRARIRVVCIDTSGRFPGEKKRRRAADKTIRRRIDAN